MKTRQQRKAVSQLHNRKSAQEISRQSKRLAYASLATVTLLGGMGATPTVLADEIFSERSELSEQPVNDTPTLPSNLNDEKPELPVADVTPAPANEQADDKITAEDTATLTMAEPAPLPTKDITPAQEKLTSAKNKSAKTANSKLKKLEKASRLGDQAYVFTKDDLVFTDTNKTVIAGFSDDFLQNRYADWNGELVFDSALSNVTGIDDYAFYGVENLVSVNLNALTNLTTIGDAAFQDNVNLTNVNFASLPKLTTIGASAFDGCYNLATFNFSGTPALETIGISAFNGCTNLTGLNFDNLTKLKTIGNSAFAGSENVTGINFEKLTALETIGDWAFADTSLTTVNLISLPHLSVIGQSAFATPDAIMKNVTLKDLPLLTSVNDQMLGNCATLVLEDLPGIETLPNQAFSNKNIEKITVQNLPNLTTLGHNVFTNNKLEEVNLLNLPKLTTLGDAPFHAAHNLETVTLDNLPLLTKVPDQAFTLSQSLTTVNFNNLPALTTIGEKAFEMCNSLANLNFDDVSKNLTTISNGALMGCGALESFDFGQFPSLSTLGDQAFGGSGLKTVDLNSLSALSTLGAGVFSDCENLTTVKLENLPQLTTIGDGALGSAVQNATFKDLPLLENFGDDLFEGTYDLTTLTIDNLLGLTSFESDSFAGADFQNLTTVNLFNLPNLITFEYNAFSELPNLTAVNLENVANVTMIGDGAFTNCENLATFAFEKLTGLTRIGEGAFCTTGLTTINLNGLADLSSIGYDAFSFNAQLTSVDFEQLIGLTIIANYAFSSNDNLTAFAFEKIPNLTTIGAGAFSDTGLTAINLSGLTNLTSIGSFAFSNTRSLQQVTVGELAPDIIADFAFFNTRPGGFVVPADASALDTARAFIDKINGNEASGSYNEFLNADRWTIGASITYKYVDESGKVIKQDTDGHSVIPFSFTGYDGASYDIPAVPEIKGYDEPKLISGDETGVLAPFANEIVYQYRTEAQPFTIFWVDTDGNELDSQTYSGYIDDEFDLTPKLIQDYDFQELAGSVLANDNTRSASDFNWMTATELAGQKMKFGDNNGRSYKFIYAKKVALPDDNNNQGQPGDNGTTDTKPDKPTGKPVVPGNIPGPAGGTKPANKPINNPTNLPISGDDKPSGTSGTQGGGTTTTSQNSVQPNNNSQTTQAQTGSLPKSGRVTDYLLPVLGAVLVGIIGLVTFRKRRN
ncbi:LPXTG cell wall anchor domain-containing protein [Periweissella cryptocerci]|uniref:LPXTG cell wall anchor domain-containing protein n=1 Tax=Periweissella cryptocerci TaxID=2506420 RepID=A0A4P6YSJ4_9LACO|nr:leucine-rich repeat protein [Periweissella cryptocerci]QBO35684.1 LPXTG cell wall anchor domain-containing protein [Periweissella cryptocerci]